MSIPAPELAIPGELFTAHELEQAKGILKRVHGLTDKETRIAIGGAFMVYRQVMQRRLASELTATESLTSGQVTRKAQDLLKTFMPGWRAMMVPILAQAYTNGARQTGYAVDPAYIDRLATRYATQLGTKLNDVSAEAMGRGFQAQVNRNIVKRVALENVISSFGVSRKTTNALVNLWVVKEEIKAHDRDVGSLKKQRVKRLVNAALHDRAIVIGENESWTAREQGKQIAWMYAKRQGLVNSNSRRRWVTAKDEKVCPYCGPMHKKEVAVEEQFKVQGVGKIWSPPLHPRCRCHIELDQGGATEIPMSSWGRVKRFINLFKDPDNTVRKSDDNDSWKTQPRATNGQFGFRPKHHYAEAEMDLQRMVDDASRAEQLKELDRALQKPGYISRLREEQKQGKGFGGEDTKGFGEGEERPGFGGQQHGFGPSRGFGAAQGFGAATGFGTARGFGGEELGPRPTDIPGEVEEEKPEPKTPPKPVTQPLKNPMMAVVDYRSVVPRGSDKMELTGKTEFRARGRLTEQLIREHVEESDRRFLKDALQGNDYIEIENDQDENLVIPSSQVQDIINDYRRGEHSKVIPIDVVGRVDEAGRQVRLDDWMLPRTWTNQESREDQLDAYFQLDEQVVDTTFLPVDHVAEMLGIDRHVNQSKPQLVMTFHAFTDPEMTDIQPDPNDEDFGVISGQYRQQHFDEKIVVDGVVYPVTVIEPDIQS